MDALVDRVRLSVLTVTHNRRALLEKKLAALARQSLAFEQFELIVCVNGSSDGTLELLASAGTPYALTVLPLETPVGIAAARNTCARAARGSTLYFSDDDCLPEPETLEKHLAAQTTACMALGGLEFIHEGTREHWQPGRARFWQLNGANSSVPAASFWRAGGFDETLSGYGGEDVLLGYLLSKCGLPFTFLPDASAQHLGPNPLTARDSQKARSAGRNAVRIAAKYPQLAYRLGVHRTLLSFKLLFLKPRWLWHTLAPAVYDYERAYLEGALEEKRDRQLTS